MVAQRTGRKLDTLVNNARAGFVSPLLDVDIAEAKKLYDADLWGHLATTQEFAPLFIEANGIGSNHSSFDAFLSMVWASIFGKSKAAEAHMSEPLYFELGSLGVRVVTVLWGVCRHAHVWQTCRSDEAARDIVLL